MLRHVGKELIFNYSYADYSLMHRRRRVKNPGDEVLNGFSKLLGKGHDIFFYLSDPSTMQTCHSRVSGGLCWVKQSTWHPSSILVPTGA